MNNDRTRDTTTTTNNEKLNDNTKNNKDNDKTTKHKHKALPKVVKPGSPTDRAERLRPRYQTKNNQQKQHKNNQTNDGSLRNSTDIIVSSSSSSSSPLPLPSLSPSPSATKSLDSFLTIYQKFVSSPTHTERGIKLLQWTIWLLSRLTQTPTAKRMIRNPQLSIQRQIRRRAPPLLSNSLRKFYSDLSLFRYVLRLYGGPVALGALVRSVQNSRDAQTKPQEEETQTVNRSRIDILTNVSNLGYALYYPFESLALFGWTMNRGFDGNFWSAWSCRVWFVSLLADFVKAFWDNDDRRERVRRLRYQSCNGDSDGADVDVDVDGGNQNHNNDDELSRATTTTTTSTTNDTQDQIQSLEEQIYQNKLQMARCLLFVAPCTSWMMPNWATDPLLSEEVANGFSLVEAVVAMYQSLRSL